MKVVLNPGRAKAVLGIIAIVVFFGLARKGLLVDFGLDRIREMEDLYALAVLVVVCVTVAAVVQIIVSGSGKP